MSSQRALASTVRMAAVVLIVWNSPAAAGVITAGSQDAAGSLQAQAQPRDPRSDVPRPVSQREEALKAATTADPANVANWLELARLQETRGALADAERTLKSALDASISRVVLTSLAAFYTRTGHFDEAVGALESAADLDPSDPVGHQLVATHYMEKAQKDLSLTPADKLKYLDAGIAATDRALAQKADHLESLTYKNILLRLKANLETDAMRRQALITEADALRNRAMALRAASASASPSSPPPPPPPGSDMVDGLAPLRVGGTIKTPTKIQDVRPVYPQEALDARVSGMVIIEAVIDVQGNVHSARVLRSIPILDQAALDAVKGWRFTPTLLNGAPVPVIMTVTVNFTVQ